MKSLSLARRAALLASAALLATGLAACGNENDDETATDSSSSSSESSSTASDSASPSETSSESVSESASASASESASAAPAEDAAWAPAIETDGDLVTGLDFTGTPKPNGKLQVATVIEGDGPAVQVGQNITANYFGSVYGSDTPFDESYSKQPFTAPIGVGSLIQGWDETIPGIPVGSRIIMSIPPELGYGDRDSGPIPGGSTLYFVIDILDAA